MRPLSTATADTDIDRTLSVIFPSLDPCVHAGDAPGERGREPAMMMSLKETFFSAFLKAARMSLASLMSDGNLMIGVSHRLYAVHHVVGNDLSHAGNGMTLSSLERFASPERMSCLTIFPFSPVPVTVVMETPFLAAIAFGTGLALTAKRRQERLSMISPRGRCP